MPGNFIDTNVLIYLASADTAKANRAEAIVENGGTISVQVLNEVTNVARRKMHLSWMETDDLLSMIRGLLKVRDLTVEGHDLGLSLSRRYGFSVFDSMIVASALQSGCDILWSEDMQDEMVIEDSLRIVNPFRQT